MPDFLCLEATTQGYPNSIKGEGKISPNGREGGILVGGGEFFYWVLGIWAGVIVTIQTFFKAKNNIL